MSPLGNSLMTIPHHRETQSALPGKMDIEKIDPRKQKRAQLECMADSALALRNLSLLGFICLNIGFCPMEQTPPDRGGNSLSYSTGHAPFDGASGAQQGAPVSFMIAASLPF